MIDSGEYVGPIEGLKGERALIRPDLATYTRPLEERKLLAQFNSLGVKHPETFVVLSHGWHEFPAAHFKILIRLTA